MVEADIVRASLVPVMIVGGWWIWRSRRAIVGRWMILIGACHLAGVWVGRHALRRIVESGVWGQADSAVGHIAERSNQELLLWFALWGVWMIFLGQVVIRLERQGATLPRWFGWQFFAVNLGAAILLPKGGFWWALIPALMIIRQSGDRQLT